MENSLMMLVHSVVIGVIAYLVMFYALKQKQIIAQNRSLLLFAFVLAYMILFGHGLPTSINKNL